MNWSPSSLRPTLIFLPHSVKSAFFVLYYSDCKLEGQTGIPWSYYTPDFFVSLPRGNSVKLYCNATYHMSTFLHRTIMSAYLYDHATGALTGFATVIEFPRPKFLSLNSYTCIFNNGIVLWSDSGAIQPSYRQVPAMLGFDKLFIVLSIPCFPVPSEHHLAPKTKSTPAL